VYVTTGVGGHVLAISIDPATGTQVGSPQVLASTGLLLADITLKSDGSLYYATSRDIRRVGSSQPVAVVAGAQELRFSAYNCLFYNSPAGVNAVGCGAGGAGAGGAGLAFDLFGNLLAVSGTTVVRIPVDQAGVLGAPVPLVTSGLIAPSGIAVASGKGANGLERGDFVVTDDRFVRLYDGKTGALKNALYATMPKENVLGFADFDADDRLWVASRTLRFRTGTPNGRIFRVDAGNAVCADQGGTDCALAALLPAIGDRYLPAIGLALSPSSRLLTRSLTPMVPNAPQAVSFDFGASIVEISGTVIDGCDLRVRSSTRFAPDAAALVNSPQYSLNPYLGEEGFVTVYQIEAAKAGRVVPASDCFDIVSGPFVFVAALTATEINPRVLRCENGCGEIEFFGWWHTGPIDGDGEGGGRTDNFSDWLIVEKAIAPPPSRVAFCGVEPPLRNDGRAVFVPGATLTVRMQFSTPGQPCNGTAFLTDPNARFLISLARVSPTHERKLLLNRSGNPGDPPVLNLVGKYYEYELTLDEADGTDFAEGTYELTVTDVTPEGTRLAAPATVYFGIKAREEDKLPEKPGEQ
jgi:hypothetical protein